MENNVNEEVQYVNTLVGGDISIIISQEEELFEYAVYRKKELLWSGGQYETYEEVVAELSEVHESLRAIFG